MILNEIAIVQWWIINKYQAGFSIIIWGFHRERASSIFAFKLFSHMQIYYEWANDWMKSEYSRACNLSDNFPLHFNVHSTFFFIARCFHLFWMTSFYVKILNIIYKYSHRWCAMLSHTPPSLYFIFHYVIFFSSRLCS